MSREEGSRAEGEAGRAGRGDRQSRKRRQAEQEAANEPSNLKPDRMYFKLR